MFEFVQSRKFLVLLLVVLIGMNIFLIARDLGQQTRRQMMMGRLTERQIERLVAAAPEAKQQQLRETLSSNMTDIQQDLDAVHRERQNLADLMVAEKFNEDALQRQFAILRVRMNYLQKHLQLMTMNMLRDLSPEERVKAVQMMQPEKLWRPKTPIKGEEPANDAAVPDAPASKDDLPPLKKTIEIKADDKNKGK